MSRALLGLALHFAAIAAGVHLMAAAVDQNDPRAARTVFVVLMGMGAGVGWLARGVFYRWLDRRATRAALLDLEDYAAAARASERFCRCAKPVPVPGDGSFCVECTGSIRRPESP